MVSHTELRDRLQVPETKLRAWIAAGLPRVKEGRTWRYDPAAVAEWLVANGHAEKPNAAPVAAPASSPNSLIAVTRDEAAHALGVSLRTIAEWCKDPSFPGRPGDPSKRNGYFPIAEIEAWRHAKDGTRAAESLISPRERLLRIRGDREELKYHKDRARLVDADEIERLLRRIIATVKAGLEPLGDELAEALTAEMREALGPELIRRVNRRLDDAYTVIAELLEGDTDPIVDEEEPST